MDRPRIALIGCGNRGADVYAAHLYELGAEIAYLIEPRAVRLAEVAARFGVPARNCFREWDDFYASGKVADAVIIATPDHQHVTPCLRALELGYDVLLEKPVCLDPSEMDLLLNAEAASNGRVTVCHVLRTSPFFVAVREVLDSGRLGQLVGIQHSENVAYWHYAHSYVRGNWRQSPPAAPFVLAKSCHDLDLLRWFADSPPVRVSSEGGLHHFRPENAPPGAAPRCVGCRVMNCPYDATRFYPVLPADQWPVTVLTAGGLTLEQALTEGPYGECVYAGKSNVVDHQAVTVTFASGLCTQLTVTAFTHNNTRTLKIVGSHGELRGQMELGVLEFHDFRTGETEVTTTPTEGIHGGGDRALAAAWLRSLTGQAAPPTSLGESLDSHRMAFAAEQSRLAGRVVRLDRAET